MCSIYHAGGTNTIAAGEPLAVRTVCTLGFTKGYLKQEENQYLAIPAEKLAKLPLEAQLLAGWTVAPPYLWAHIPA
jgi:ectoine hydroxylase-related dioxygenase (phytanoyl-CoA dioxygenase family)